MQEVRNKVSLAKHVECVITCDIFVFRKLLLRS